MGKKILIIDVGNTATEFAIFEDGKIIKFFGHYKLPDALDDITNSLKSFSPEELQIDDGMIFSVVPSVNKMIEKLVKKFFDKSIPIFDWHKYKLDNKSPLITEPIGADLLADIKATEAEIGGPCLIVDCGTITKLLLIDETCTFVGLSFVPGIETSLKSFKMKTELLPYVEEIVEPGKELGTDTLSSMHHGVYWSTVYFIKEVLKSVKYENCKLAITGGNLRFIKNAFHKAIIDQELTLKGMYILYNEVAGE